MSLPLVPDRFAAAPEPEGRPCAFGLLPDELGALPHHRSNESLFGSVQRPWTWEGEEPRIGKRAAAVVENLSFALPRLVEAVESADGSTRCVLETFDGHRIEAVHMPRDVKSPRVTLCISSQVGCAMGCTFCATGTMGIKRNLTAGEIVGQVLLLLSRFGPRAGHLVNVVFMGMGEPLHNLDHVEKALAVLCHPAGLAIPPRRITVSTSGLVPGIERLARADPRPLLALSVNATTDVDRARTMPVTRAWGLVELKDALLAWPYRKKEKVTLEYVLRQGENDTQADAQRLAAFAEGLPHHVNLIPLNEHDRSESRRPDDKHVFQFADWLYEEGVRAFIRFSRGQDVQAACGQLVQGPARRRSAS